MTATALAAPLARIEPARITLADQLRYAAEGLTRLRVPSIDPRYPDPEDFKKFNDFLFDVASVIDPLLEAVGGEVKSNAPAMAVRFDLDAFRNIIREAISGNATYEIQQVAEQVEDDQREDD